MKLSIFLFFQAPQICLVLSMPVDFETNLWLSLSVECVVTE